MEYGINTQMRHLTEPKKNEKQKQTCDFSLERNMKLQFKFNINPGSHCLHQILSTNYKVPRMY